MDYKPSACYCKLLQSTYLQLTQTRPRCFGKGGPIAMLVKKKFQTNLNHPQACVTLITYLAGLCKAVSFKRTHFPCHTQTL